MTPEGTRARRFVYGRTWDECHDKLIEMKAKTAQGVPLAVKAWTLDRYLMYWLTDVAGRRLRPITLAGYGQIVRVHLVPTLGKKRLDRLSPQDVRQLLAAKRQAGLSVRTVQYIHAVLRNALQNAVREELVTRNVAKLVQVETPDYDTGRGLTLAQARALLAAVKSTRWHGVYVLALMLGLRRGELLGLRWADVDLASRRRPGKRRAARAAIRDRPSSRSLRR
jgi:integrase